MPIIPISSRPVGNRQKVANGLKCYLGTVLLDGLSCKLDIQRVAKKYIERLKTENGNAKCIIMRDEKRTLPGNTLTNHIREIILIMLALSFTSGQFFKRKTGEFAVQYILHGKAYVHLPGPW